MSTEWLGPRVFAVLSALSAAAAIVYPLIGALWAFGPWLLATAGFAWISHDMSATVRRRHQAAHDQRRDWSDRVNVWVLPPPRVSRDPDVALLARVFATPAPRTWPLGGWNADVAECGEYDGDLRRLAEQP